MLLTQKLLKQGYQYHKLCKTFPKFYLCYYDLIFIFHVGLKSLWCQTLSETEFYGNLVYNNNLISAIEWGGAAVATVAQKYLQA